MNNDPTCEYCGEAIEGVVPIHRVCGLRWLLRFHENEPPTSDWGILVLLKELEEAQKLNEQQDKDKEN